MNPNTTPNYAAGHYNPVYIGNTALKCPLDSWTIVVHVKLAPGYSWQGAPGTIEVQLNAAPPGAASTLGYVLIAKGQEQDSVTFVGSGAQNFTAAIDDPLHADWKLVRNENVSIADGQKKEVTLELRIPKVMFRVFDEVRKQVTPDVTIDLEVTWKGAVSQPSHVTTPAVLVVMRVDEGSTVKVREMSHASEVWEVTKVESA